MPRSYRLKRRAARQEETKLRIVDAVVALHGELGPARTTISAIAERAGVQRHTVYRYFPEESEIFRACASRFLSLHPPTDPHAWLVIADPVERLRTGLAAAYAYFRENAALMGNVLRDAEVLPVGSGFFRLRAAMTEVLAQGWEHAGQDPQLRAAIGLAVSFPTWRTLVRDHELEDPQAVELMTRLVLCTAERLGAETSGPEERRVKKTEGITD
jgi:AcrR family transcriptional regulator